MTAAFCLHTSGMSGVVCFSALGVASEFFWREGCEVIDAWVQDALNRPAGGNIGWWGGWTSVCRPFLGFELYVREAGGRPRVAEDALTEERAFFLWESCKFFHGGVFKTLEAPSRWKFDRCHVRRFVR